MNKNSIDVVLIILQNIETRMIYFGPTTTATTFLRVSSSISMEVLSLLNS